MVGLPASGTLRGTSGTALGDQEARAVGQHSHSASFGHVHSIPAVVTGAGSSGFLFTTGSPVAVNTALPGDPRLFTEDAGSVPGTNAPYVQPRACRKS